MTKEENITVPRWFLEVVENTLRIQDNINLDKKTGETCQDRNIHQSLNGIRKLLNEEELTGMERLEKLQPSLPDNLDEAAEEWCKRNNKGIALCGDKKSHYLTEGVDAFKAGVKWMASQGVSTIAISSTEEDGITEEGMKLISDYLESLPDKTEVVLQIRKKQ